MEQLLKASDVAGLTQLSVRSVYRALENGSLTGTRLGGVWRIPRAELDAWIQASTHRAKPDMFTRPLHESKPLVKREQRSSRKRHRI